MSTAVYAVKRSRVSLILWALNMPHEEVLQFLFTIFFSESSLESGFRMYGKRDRT